MQFGLEFREHRYLPTSQAIGNKILAALKLCTPFKNSSSKIKNKKPIAIYVLTYADSLVLLSD
jgi:hypothetical protein